jgi:hypothetical protein
LQHGPSLLPQTGGCKPGRHQVPRTFRMERCRRGDVRFGSKPDELDLARRVRSIANSGLGFFFCFLIMIALPWIAPKRPPQI